MFFDSCLQELSLNTLIDFPTDEKHLLCLLPESFELIWLQVSVQLNSDSLILNLNLLKIFSLRYERENFYNYYESLWIYIDLLTFTIIILRGYRL
jgi:hypothetical protein